LLPFDGRDHVFVSQARSAGGNEGAIGLITTLGFAP